VAARRASEKTKSHTVFGQVRNPEKMFWVTFAPQFSGAFEDGVWHTEDLPI
jgi:hypothetical protein